MRALVTGGGGFLGKRIVEMLRERGDEVRIFSRSDYPELAALGVDCVQGDLRDADAVVAACRDCDVVFHVAAKAGIWGDRVAYHEVNIKGTANVIRGCVENRIAALVHTSSPSVVIGTEDIENGDESLPYPETYLADYPATKAIAEKMVLDADGWEMVSPDEIPLSDPGGVRRLRVCAIRPHLIWGPGDPHLIPRIVAAAKSGRIACVGSGENRVDVTYVDNAAHAHILAADELRSTARCAGKAYFIGDEEAVVLWRWTNDLLKRLGVPEIRRCIPFRLAYVLGACLEVLHRLFPGLGEPRMTRFVAVQFSRSHWFCHKAAREDFGYEPIVSGDDGLKLLVEWMRKTQSW